MKTVNCLRLSVSLLLVAAAASAQDSTTSPNTRPKLVPATPITSATPAKPAPVGAAAARESKLLANGSVAPDFISNDLAGKAVRLADSKGKILVLDFWATWCGPCQKSLPHTQSVAKQLKAQGVVVLAVCTSDTRAKFEAWVKAKQETYPDIIFTCDPNEKGSATYGERASQKLYGVAGIPTQFIIGRDGKVAAALVGFSEERASRLENALAKVGVGVRKDK